MEHNENVVAAQLRALAFACVEAAATDALPDALLDAWFAASRAQRAEWAAGSPLAARHLGGELAVGVNADDVARISAAQGNLRCLRWALQSSVYVISHHAAENGHLACLTYAHERGCPWNKNTCLYAAQNGHLACLQYAHEHGCPWNSNTCSHAALTGHLACLKYARENGCEWYVNTCASAAQKGHLACLRYAHEHGCAWDSNTCWLAARNGHLDCLAYAHEHGCAWNETACSQTAEANGRLDCLAYIKGGSASKAAHD